MGLRRKIKAAWLVVVLGFAMTGSASDKLRQFDEFGDINCEDEMARLDNLVIQMQNEPETKAVIIFYGGKLFRGKLPRRGEAAARAARLKPYLVNRRAIAPERVIVTDGGYTEEWHVEIWLIPINISAPSTTAFTIPIEKIRFRPGKTNPRSFQCKI